MPDDAALEWFWARVDRSGGPDACHFWSGATDSSGYGTLRFRGRQVGAHRLAYELTHGPIALRMQLLHGPCDTRNPGTTGRRCCNPRHLTPGTARANAHDRGNKGRSPRQRARGRPISEQHWRRWLVPE